MPYITTVVPWEAWYFGRGAKDPTKSPFRYGYHFCFGVKNFFDAYTHLWPQVATNKKVGVMWPNDADGNAIRAALGPLLEKAGYTIVDPGAYQDGTTDYSAQITKFKSEGVQIFNTFPIPPDFATFWRQAAQQGLTKPGEDRADREDRAVPVAGDGARCDRQQPRERLLLAPDLARTARRSPGSRRSSSRPATRSASGKQWNQQAGPSLALFDVAMAALKKSGKPKDKNAVADAMKSVKVETPIGVLDWTKARPGVPCNVVPTPIPGGQWRKAAGKFKIDFTICEHSDDPKIPIGGKLRRTRPEPARSTMEPMLAAVGVSKRFGALVVLDGVDFAVGPRRGGRHRRARTARARRRC